jgi:2-polyprenyl-3-methyl-5-hydroxy-6-metoxy-1,4-benzoquinol methylase
MNLILWPTCRSEEIDDHPDAADVACHRTRLRRGVCGRPELGYRRPQRAFVQLLNAGLIRSPVLDVGCGTGELSMFLARNGYQVLGVDLSGVAIE